MTTRNFIPYVVERTSDGERSYDIYSRLLKERIVFLATEVNEEISHAIVAQMLHLEAEDPKSDINFYINSPGGLVTAGLAIYDTMQFINPDVSTIVIGQAASMGSLLATAGAAGKRYMLPNARHMIHQPSGGAIGQASDVEIMANEILKLKKELTNIYVKHNSKDISYEEFTKAMDRDNFLSPQESLDFGLIDKIIEKRNLQEDDE